MKRLVIVSLLIVVVSMLIGCQAFSSAEPTQPPPPPAGATQPAATKPAGTAPTIPPAAGKCQSRLWGKVTATGGAIKPNATIDIVAGNFKAKTQTDANGLYGFAGLCAGEYSLSATPQGGAAQAWPNKIPVDGANEVKLDVQVK